MVNLTVVQGYVAGATLDKDKNGSPYVFFDICHLDFKKEKNWFKCFMFGGVAEVMVKRLKDGRNIICQGHLRSRNREPGAAIGPDTLMASLVVTRVDFIQTEQENDLGGS